MKLTEEQIKIINANEKEIKVLAGAGAAKTTTLVEYVRLRPNKKFLYIAFNKSVEEEAKRKFKFPNIVIKTAHGLAYSNYVRPNKYKVTNELKTEDIAELWPKSYREYHDFYKFMYDLKKAFEIYCTIPQNRILTKEDLYVESDNYLRNINKGLALIIKSMLNKKLSMTHDAYLKFYYLKKPDLDYDTILFDEGQDASPVMLAIFNSQDCQKIIVGDNNQSIYKFRKAINALGALDYKTYSLSTSFRFGSEIAEIANKILLAKDKLGMKTDFKINGLGLVADNNQKALICRSNAGVLSFILNNPNLRIYLEGGAKGYDFSAAGMLSDIYKLSKRKRGLIKSDLIREFETIDELSTFAKSRNDFKILNCIELIRKYGGNVFSEIKKAKERIVERKEDCSIIVSTIHKSKGMEYGHVLLCKDIKTIHDLIEGYKKTDMTKSDFLDLQEELNLVYVAVTRAIKTLSYEL